LLKSKNTKSCKLRDDEKRIEKELAIAQEQWEEDEKTIELKLQRTTYAVCIYDEDSVNRIAQNKAIN
jgi:ATP-dependent Clp protease ATP-binding subunit ClpC